MERGEIPHHREVLQEHADEIEYYLSDCVTEEFTNRYESEGWTPSDDPLNDSSDAMSLDEFADKFREEYEIDSLREFTLKSYLGGSLAVRCG